MPQTPSREHDCSPLRVRRAVAAQWHKWPKPTLRPTQASHMHAQAGLRHSEYPHIDTVEKYRSPSYTHTAKMHAYARQGNTPSKEPPAADCRVNQSARKGDPYNTITMATTRSCRQSQSFRPEDAPRTEESKQTPLRLQWRPQMARPMIARAGTSPSLPMQSEY